MKKSVTALDLHFLVKEWRRLVDSKVDKIFCEDDFLLFQLHSASLGKSFFEVRLPDIAFISDTKHEFDAPNAFCMSLRKHLGGARIRSIDQVGFERIVSFILERKGEKIILYIELFSKGNMIVCKEDGTILTALKFQKWSERTVRGGVEYKHPSKDINILASGKDQILSLFKGSDKPAVVVLAKGGGLGGEYAEEALKRAGVDKDATSIGEEEASVIARAIHEMAHGDMSPRLYSGKGFYPFRMVTFEGIEEAQHETLNGMINGLFHSVLAMPRHDKRSEKYNREKAKLEGILKQQEAQIEELKVSVTEQQEKGDALYREYALVKDILESLALARKKYSLKEIKEKLKGHNVVKEIDVAGKEIAIELDDR